jgi:acyl-CoA synthetase (AMP-forming)/AMP-acid ligase II
MTEASNILDRLRRHGRDAPSRLALREIISGKTLTYSQLQTAIDEFAARLKRELPADAVVMLRCGNRCNYHIAFYASLAAGLTVFPISPDMTDREISRAGEKASATAVIQEDLTLQPLTPSQPADMTGPALLLQSSGTTGLPKIVRRDAASLDAVAASMTAALGIESSDQVLACVPLCHSYGLEHGLLAPIFAGASVHLAGDFDPTTFHREFAETRVTVLPAVPSVYEILANQTAAAAAHSLRLAYSAGAPLPTTVYERMRERFGVKIGQLYGATEIGSVTFAHPASANFQPSSVGRAMDGVELQFDVEGQLLVRAKSLMSGYVDDASPLTPDGFFPTGDLGHLDAAGNLFITGRLKLLIDVGGLKVNPLEVEQAICEHPDVAACIVVPIRQSETVSRLKAIVTASDPLHPPVMSELRSFVRERLTSHKIPRVFELRESMPRSATGKILRHLLLENA